MRHPEHRHFSIAEMLERARAEMMPMPTPFDGFMDKSARVSSTCLVTVDRNRYSVQCELAGQMVSARLYTDRVRVVAADERMSAMSGSTTSVTETPWLKFNPGNIDTAI